MKSFRKHMVEKFDKLVGKLELERKANTKLVRRIKSLSTVIQNAEELLIKGHVVKATRLLSKTVERLEK